MSSRPLRFVQAGDFMLHQPFSGLMDVPEHLVERLIEAPTWRLNGCLTRRWLKTSISFC